MSDFSEEEVRVKVAGGELIDRVSDRDRQHLPAGGGQLNHDSFYSGLQQKKAALLNIYWRHLKPGDLVFDIGANVGDFTHVYLSLGCRVVAVEPQPEAARFIPRQATVIEAAAGAAEGTATMLACEGNTTMSTLKPRYADHALYLNSAWHATPREVPVVTLDGLIAEYGRPAFIKIDVEGSEADVLAGLSWGPPALAFEVNDFDPDKGQVCMELLAGLGDYGYLYSPMETFELEPWPPLRLALFGDVYATRRDV